jgi:CBS domain-containing protein
MSAPVQTVPAHVVCFDALLTMMARNIHHLAVESQGEITGILTTHDIMVLQGTSPLYLFREILAQRKIEGLYPLAAKIPQVVRTLVEEGAKANNIARMITVLNDHVLERLITLLVKELGPPPLPFCWMLLGSEGRKEQTFKTDQDNALIFQEPENEEQAAAANSYFTSLGERAIAHLQGCGFPPCPGDIMASNPRWRMPVSGWQHSFENWIYRPDPQEIRNATIFFDFRAGPGEATLVDRLRAHLSPLARDQEIFLRYLAKDCLESRPPISFLRNFLVEKDGEHRNLLDLKKRGLVPFVDFARVMALRCGIQASNTVDRLRLLRDGNHIPAALGAEAMEAYEFIMHLRLLHQMHLLEGGEMPDNFINPGDLTDLEKKTLKEAFGVVRSLQSFLRQEFRIEQG